MYTVEMEDDETIVTTLDESGKYEDVAVFLDNSPTVYIRQWNERGNKFEVIELSYQQFVDLFAALNSPIGAYYAKAQDRKVLK